MRKRDSNPVPRLGIVGGGQLAKMIAMAAAPFGCEVVILEKSADFPAQSLETHSLVGDWDDAENLLALAELVDVVTLENEFVSSDALGALEEKGYTLFPSTATLRSVQDKLHQKETLSSAGVPVARFGEVATRDDIRTFGLPVVLKSRFYSYDGKGNATVRTPDDIEDAWGRLDGDNNALYAEEFVPFEAELAIIVTRSPEGAVAEYPVVETVNKDHICHVVRAPAGVAGSTSERVRELAKLAVQAIDGVGSFGFEFFLLRDGTVLLNEVAPRVHNTGHYTIEATECSQFENHVRAVLGWPLGSTEMTSPSAAMVNLLGIAEGSGTPNGLAEALAVPGAHVHIYGKSRSARGRKMGHVTALGPDARSALSVAQAAADLIRFGDEG